MSTKTPTRSVTFLLTYMAKSAFPKRMRYLCIILLSLLLLLCACGQSTPEQAKLTWWQFWTAPEIKPTIEMLAADFEREHPEVDVTLGDLTWSDGHEKIVISLAAGKGPDIIELGSDWVCEFAAAGKLLDITDAVADLVPTGCANSLLRESCSTSQTQSPICVTIS
jgi:multiple sugar transport system substrate-binding protein